MHNHIYLTQHDCSHMTCRWYPVTIRVWPGGGATTCVFHSTGKSVLCNRCWHTNASIKAYKARHTLKTVTINNKKKSNQHTPLKHYKFIKYNYITQKSINLPDKADWIRTSYITFYSAGLLRKFVSIVNATLHNLFSLIPSKQKQNKLIIYVNSKNE